MPGGSNLRQIRLSVADAHEIAAEAGDRSMRAAGREYWSNEDAAAAAAEYERLRPRVKEPARKD